MSQQKDLAEKWNKTFLVVVQSMMALAVLPISVWEYVLLTMAYVQNHISSKLVWITPYEIWICNVPNLGHFWP